MTGKMVWILNTARGNTELVSLGVMLENKGLSPVAYTEESLASNVEVQHFKSRGMLKFVSEEEHAQLLAQKEESMRPANVTIEDAVEQDHVKNTDALKFVASAQRALAELSSFLSNTEPQKKREEGKKSAPPTEHRDPKDDGLDLPMSAPAGLNPQAMTSQYLKKSGKDRKQFLHDCRDITTLRDIALFESDPKLKQVARKAAQTAESQAISATRTAQF